MDAPIDGSEDRFVCEVVRALFPAATEYLRGDGETPDEQVQSMLGHAEKHLGAVVSLAQRAWRRRRPSFFEEVHRAYLEAKNAQDVQSADLLIKGRTHLVSVRERDILANARKETRARLTRGQ